MEQEFNFPKLAHLVKTLKLPRVSFSFVDSFFFQDVFENVLAAITGMLKFLAVVKVGMLEDVTQL